MRDPQHDEQHIVETSVDPRSIGGNRMRALTLHQPWASLIAIGVKHIETRSWSTKYRGPLAIHAGQHLPGNHGIRLGDWLCRPSNQSGYELLAPGTHDGIEWNGMMPVPYEPHFGAIVATCTLVDVVPMVADGDSWDGTGRVLDVGHRWLYDDSTPSGGVDISDQRPHGDFTPGRFAWLLDDVQPCDPIPATGHQGLWDWKRASEAISE